MKKLEEAAKEYMNIPPVKAAIKCGDVEDLVSHIKVAYRNGFQDGQANQWISVEDEMPSFEDEVLCVMESNEAVVSGFIFKDGDKAKVATCPDFHFEDYGDYIVTHWMPLPELPK